MPKPLLRRKLDRVLINQETVMRKRKTTEQMIVLVAQLSMIKADDPLLNILLYIIFV